MDKTQAFPIGLPSLLRWVLSPIAAITVFGALPTWLLAGRDGVIAEVVAVGLVLGVMLGTGGLTVYSARQGVRQAVTVFLGASLFRMILCPAFVGLAWWATQLPAKAMGVWMVITYLAGLGLESAWLVTALARNLRRKAKKTKAKPDSRPKAEP